MFVRQLDVLDELKQRVLQSTIEATVKPSTLDQLRGALQTQLPPEEPHEEDLTFRLAKKRSNVSIVCA